jgi:cytochrome c biogenesis protein CcdA
MREVAILSQAFGLALLSGLWPIGLAAIAAFLDRPLLRYAFAYLAGAALAESAASTVVLVGLGATGFTRARHTRSGWFYVAVGILMLAFAVVVYLRSHRPRKTEKSDDKQNARIHEGRVTVAFGLGLVMWLPSPTYLAALKQIEDTHSGWALTTLYAGIAVILVLWIIEIPIVLFLLFREPARRYLGSANGWLQRHGADVLAGLTAVGGLGILVKGILQLA